jgi:hypothetical protein
MNNNPISFNDFLGDTSRYYSQKGALLLTIGGKGYNNAIVLNKDSEAKVKEYAKKWQSRLNELGDKITNNKQIESYFKNSGTTYDIGSFQKFYDDNGRKFLAETARGISVKGVVGKKINGKPGEFYSEVQANTLGAVKQVSGDMFSSDPTKLADETGKASNIHLHNFAEDGTWEYRIKNSFITGGGTFSGGPSGNDQIYSAGNPNGIRNVVVDSKAVYLINGDKDAMIIIKHN